MPSLILNATDISKLLDANPDVKVELLKNATDQIAESLKRKVISGVQTIPDKIVADITADVNNKLRSQYTFPVNVHEAIKEVTRRYLEKFTRADADAIVKKAIDEALKRAEERMKAAAKEVISKSFADMVDAASRLRR